VTLCFLSFVCPSEAGVLQKRHDFGIEASLDLSYTRISPFSIIPTLNLAVFLFFFNGVSIFTSVVYLDRLHATAAKVSHWASTFVCNIQCGAQHRAG